MKAQLNTVFERMESSLLLRLYLDERAVSKELQNYVESLVAMTEKLEMEISSEKEAYAPCVRLIRADGTDTGMAFHGVPGGHEFTSFVLGLYNAAGPGQAIDEDMRKRIQAVDKPVKIQVLVSLSCTMCPDLVVAASHLAALNENISTDVYDIFHFEELKNKYNVMSVPCMVINETDVYFGKKNMQEVLSFLLR